jgi:hypothetical protein
VRPTKTRCPDDKAREDDCLNDKAREETVLMTTRLIVCPTPTGYVRTSVPGQRLPFGGAAARRDRTLTASDGDASTLPRCKLPAGCSAMGK